ncbi:hypothetical protein Acor_19780 [Acrocarpospora corrugata]|uniref:CBM2 domain-containing protein n=1 Tax=Acrocarpospora corrugata TaxID=35763 RepID=A0A5M3VT14_9ACTN|nr:hypothetical protein [Acrocarpospora corrugata]GER99914.1 hypothetical protein Acor_19780 [Acrocarpospora corrugata]
MGRHRTGRDSGDGDNPNADHPRTAADATADQHISPESPEGFERWLGHLTGDGPELTYRWPEDTAQPPADEDRPAIHPAYRWDLPPKRTPPVEAAPTERSVVTPFRRKARPNPYEPGLPEAAGFGPGTPPVGDGEATRADPQLAPQAEVSYRWPDSGVAVELSGKRDSGPEVFAEPGARSRFGRTALLSGLSVLVAVGVTFAGVRLVGDRTDLVFEAPAATCEPARCGAAPAVPQPSATDFATPEDSPADSPADSPPADKAKPTPKASVPVVQAKPTPSRTASPKAKKTATPTPTEDDVPTGAGTALEEGDGPVSNDEPDQNALRLAVPSVTVAFEVTQEDFDGYSARIIVQSGSDDIADLRVRIPVSGEILTVEGAQFEVRNGQLILSSLVPLVAGEELIVDVIASGSPTPPSECVLTGGDCAIAAPPTL